MLRHFELSMLGIGVLLLALFSSPAHADWPATGLPVCTAANNQLDVVGCSDGTGGMILAWKDQRPSTAGIYVQRVSATGQVLWTNNGVRVSAIGHSIARPAVATDGSGGVWVVWEDQVGVYPDVFMQHLGAGGSTDWAPAGGAAIRQGSAFFSPERPQCESDGSGGVIVTWVEKTCARGGPLVAQRWNAAGAPQWTTPAVVVADSVRADTSLDTDAHPSGDGGILIGFVHPASQGRAQYVDLGGTPRWNGTFAHGLGLVVPGSRVRVCRREVGDLGGHALYQRSFDSPPGWTKEWRVATMIDSGFEFWDESVGADPDLGPDANLCSGDDGSCVVGWYYVEPTTDEQFTYGRQLDRDGDSMWLQLLGYRPVAFGGGAPAVAYTGSYFGYRFAWPALIDGTPRIMFRSLSNSGLALPDPGPGEVPGAIGSVTPVLVPTTFGSTTILIGWRDERTFTETDVYATAINSSGTIPKPNLVVRSFRATPNPCEVGALPHLRAVVVNQGSLATGGFSVAYWRDVAVPTGSPDWEGTDSDGLAVGDSTVFEFDEVVSATTPGTWHSWFRADFEGDVDEGTHEDDNDRDLQLQWVATPDLDITAFTVSNAAPSIDDAILYDVTVQNIGHVPSGACSVHLYYDRDSAPGVGDVGDQVLSLGALAPGAVVVLQSAPVNSPLPDLWSSRALVDATGVVDEGNENNNTAGPVSVTWSLHENEGWPVAAGTGTLNSPAIASLPTTPAGLRAVVVTSSDGHCYAWDGQGDVLAGWPYDAGAPIHSCAAVADLDGDGVPEVVFGDDDGILHCVASDGSIRWDYNAHAAIVATPVIADMIVDRPGNLEVVFGDTAGNLHLLDHLGRLVTGWPVNLGASIHASPAVGDMDGAWPPEIAVIAAVKAGSTKIHVRTPSGASYSAAWPLSVSADFSCSPALGDVIGSNDLDIVAGDQSGWLHAWNLKRLTPDLAVDLGAPIHASVALADVSLLDIKLNMLVATDVYVSTPPIGGYWHSTLWALDAAGAPLDGWPVAIARSRSDCRAGDGPIVWGGAKDARIAIGSEVGDCFVFDAQGTRLPGHTMPADGPITGSLATHDIDGDLHLEVVVAGEGAVHCYDLMEGSYAPHLLQWNQFGHDDHRSRCYGMGTVTAVDDDETPTRPLATRWLPPRPNPFNPSVELRFELARSATVKAEVYDVAGRRVRELEHATWFEAGVHSLDWDGRDAEGRTVASGAYLVRLKTDGGRDVTRVVMLK